MQAIECDGETIDQAIDKALRELGVARDRVEIEILADATRGVFGFGGKPARVRAKVRAPLDLRQPQPSREVSRETAPPIARHVVVDVPAPKERRQESRPPLRPAPVAKEPSP